MLVRILVLGFLLFLGFSVFAVHDLHSQDEELLDFSGQELDTDEIFDLDQLTPPEETPTPVPALQKTRSKEASGCRCQCLTKGTSPKNNRTFRGKLINGNCVCPCAPTDR